MPVKNESDFFLARILLSGLVNKKNNFLEISWNDWENLADMWDYCSVRIKKLILMAIPEIAAVILVYGMVKDSSITSENLKAINSAFLKTFSFKRSHCRLKKKLGNPRKEFLDVLNKIHGRQGEKKE